MIDYRIPTAPAPEAVNTRARALGTTLLPTPLPAPHRQHFFTALKEETDTPPTATQIQPHRSSPPMANKPDTPRRGGAAKFTSCLAAVAFLILTAAALVIVFLVLFRPKDPHIQVDAIQLPSFTSRNNTVTFTFAQYAAVRNPNRAAFSHYDSTLQLIYGGSQVGFMFIPAGEIEAGRTQYMEASFEVGSFPMAGGSLEVKSKMRVTGRVKVLRFFTHHVEATAGCRVGVEAGKGSVVGFRC